MVVECWWNGGVVVEWWWSGGGVVEVRTVLGLYLETETAEMAADVTMTRTATQVTFQTDQNQSQSGDRRHCANVKRLSWNSCHHQPNRILSKDFIEIWRKARDWKENIFNC